MQVAFRNHQMESSDLKGPEAVLKYYWIRKLTGTSEFKIDRVMVAPDLCGYIKIVAPPEQLTIRVAP
jgi:hypothetical protein